MSSHARGNPGATFIPHSVRTRPDLGQKPEQVGRVSGLVVIHHGVSSGGALGGANLLSSSLSVAEQASACAGLFPDRACFHHLEVLLPVSSPFGSRSFDIFLQCSTSKWPQRRGY